MADKHGQVQGVLLAEAVHQGLVGGVFDLMIAQEFVDVADEQGLVARESGGRRAGGDGFDGVV